MGPTAVSGPTRVTVHSHEAAKLKAPCVTAKQGLLGLAKEDVEHNVVCPGIVRTKALGVSEAEAALYFAAPPTNALTGQPMVAGHGWCMQ